jgi:predicted nucleic acid-binding protein
VIYVDSSVVLAKLLAEKRTAPNSFWNESLVSSRLLEYEAWNRIHARQLARALGEQTETLFQRIEFIELLPATLARALAPFPIPLRTLDTLHVATIEYLRRIGRDVALASFDERMLISARALHIPLYHF